MKTVSKLVMLFLVLSASLSLHADIVIGNYNQPNCYPLMCNDSGVSTGLTMDYQQVYAAGQFPGVTSINSLTFTFASAYGGPDLILGGNYTLGWGYASANSLDNLSTNLPSNYIIGPFPLTMVTIPAGGKNFGAAYTFTFPTITYDPALGNFLLEIVAYDQDNVTSSGGQNSFMEADVSGSVTSRALCYGNNRGCGALDTGLVTTFGTPSSSTPEPSSILLLGSGILGLTGVLRRKLFII